MREKQKNINTSNSNPADHYEMSALEKNIVSMVKAQFRDDDPVGKRYFVSIQELNQKLKELGQKATLEDIQDEADKLLSRIYRIFDGSGIPISMCLFASVVYTDGADLIKVEIFSEVRRVMMEYDFTTYSGWSVLRLKSIYAKVIYEMLLEHKDVGVFKISVEDLRERLKMEREKLSGWTAFEKTVLRTSQKEINEKTELNTTYTLIKACPKYTEIEFHIEKKETTDLQK